MNTAVTVCINYSDTPADFLFKPKTTSGGDKQLHEEFSGQDIAVPAEAVRDGLEITLKPFESKIFTYQM